MEENRAALSGVGHVAVGQRLALHLSSPVWPGGLYRDPFGVPTSVQSLGDSSGRIPVCPQGLWSSDTEEYLKSLLCRKKPGGW